MPKVTLIINGAEEFEMTAPLVTIGRTSDNGIPLNDSNVSRYHARIEQREDGYWLVEQNSSNGTAVNGEEVDGEILLQDGDVMTFGGSSTIEFNEPEEESDEEEPDEEEKKEAAATSNEPAAGGSKLTLVAGAVVGLAVISVAAAGIFYWSNSGSSCNPSAIIKSPDRGEILSKSVEVKVDVENAQCVETVVFTIDGKEFASSNAKPYQTTLDPSNFGDLVDGRNHQLQVILLDKEEKQIGSGSGIEVGFETLAEPLPPQPEPETPPTGVPTPRPKRKGPVNDIEIQEMAQLLLQRNFPNAPVYKLDPLFLAEVNKKTLEYTGEGYYNRALKYKDLINVAYQRERDVGVPIGYILAMSRSKFNLQKQGNNEGLWQMSNELIMETGSNELCGTETLSDESQNCAANVSANYLKAIFLDRFEGDIVYTLAAFGMNPQEAAEYKARVDVTPNRLDFWKVLTPQQREEVVKFFAAGIVTANPVKFGLRRDLPLWQLYPQ
jgi:hypothetical protein